MAQSIQPLRINKGTPYGSPVKANGTMSPRPLGEVNPMERRRNSPSFDKATKSSFLDSSPFDSSPFASKFNTSPFSPNSTRAYWQNRDATSPTRQNGENRDPREGSPSPAKRSSIENLKRASRVKNSSIFAREQKQEYDPASTPLVERPLAAGRAFNIQSNSPWSRPSDVRQSDVLKSPQTSPFRSPGPGPVIPEPQKSPSRTQLSPTKSSLSKSSRYGHGFDPENGTWSDEDDSYVHELPPGKALLRHPKSVTFDAAPPQVNEYEMTTPDPSSIASGSREGSYDSVEDEGEAPFEFQTNGDHDDSFDASLEDTDKTPVVLPEDWRFMSPDRAVDDLAATFEDPFALRKSSPTETIQPQNDEVRPPTRTDSRNSDGESRPLPPLPPPPAIGGMRERSSSNSSLQATAERVASLQRNLPSPPRPASISKSELQGMGSSAMALEDRLRLMMLQEEEKSPSAKSPADEQRERRLRRAGSSPDRTLESTNLGFHIHEDGAAENEDALSDYQLPPMIKRESILRKVKSQHSANDYSYSSSPSSSPERAPAHMLDPDVPIPSLEDRPQPIVADDGKVIKQEDEESEVDQYAIPEMYRHGLASPTGSNNHDQFADDDDESHYSTDLNGIPETKQPFIDEEEAPPTPRASESLGRAQIEEQKKQNRMSLPQFAAMLGREDFSNSFSHYMTPSPPVQEPAKREQPPASFQTQPAAELQRPATPVEQFSQAYEDTESDRESTPESVIRHPIAEPIEEEVPIIPEPSATIKAPGGSLKTRPSLAPADIHTMAETRRKVSGDRPPMPPVPEKHQNRPSVIPEGDSFFNVEEQSNRIGGDRQQKRKSSLIQLNVPVEDTEERLSLGLDKEFDRLLEAQKVAFAHFLGPSDDFTQGLLPWQESQLSIEEFANLTPWKQKGYLMRQNTKLVVASSGSHDSSNDTAEGPKLQPRVTKSAGNSPVKSSATWTTEPWNGRIRRKSIRQSGGSPMKRPAAGPAPPLPGMSSNVMSSSETAVVEPDALPEIEEYDDGTERGRLFVKVVGVKDLDLPLPRGERSYFCLTLDNGLHCVTTAWLEMGKNAPIGQEFELVVLNDLEFQLTLATKLEEPKPIKPVESPSKVPKLKQSTFSRVFASPKKRKELEMKQQEEAQRIARQKQQEAEAARRRQPSAWDLLHKLVNRDGSFARSYISLKDHETRSYGRPYTVDVPCFNEWATEEGRTAGSSKSGRSLLNGVQRKAPYKIGKLELQLLYVPKPKEATDEDMPKSMNACVRDLQDAERTAHQQWEGHLSQQGGDCPYWRRRFFRLEGSKLTAYHEATRQPRATINLAKASKLVDDKSSLTQKEVTGKGGHRRRSAFAAEEEGYMFVEEGFRMRFANGEVIDFYADSTADKEGWMRALAEVVGKDNKTSRSWTEIVLRKERAAATKAGKSSAVMAPNHVAMKSAPNTPAKHHHQAHASHSSALAPGANGSPQKLSYSRPFSHLPTPNRPNSADKPLPQTHTGGRDPRGRLGEAERRNKSRSMLF